MWRDCEASLQFPNHRISEEGSMNCAACSDVQLKLIQTIQTSGDLRLKISFEQLSFCKIYHALLGSVLVPKQSTLIH